MGLNQCILGLTERGIQVRTVNRSARLNRISREGRLTAAGQPSLLYFLLVMGYIFHHLSNPPAAFQLPF